MACIPYSFLARVESLGDNCELGFVLRNLNYEKSGLFRWTVTPVEKLISFLEDLDQDFFERRNLQPFSPGMVIDQNTGFSFHSKMRSERDDKGELVYVHSSSEMADIYKQEKSKIDYLLTGFVERLSSQYGTIYLIKSNSGIAPDDISQLAVLINQYSEKHVLIEVRSTENYNDNLPLKKTQTHYVAELSKFAPYTQADEIFYDDWNLLLTKIMNHDEIIDQIGNLPVAV